MDYFHAQRLASQQGVSVDNEPRDIYDLWYLLKLNINITKIRGELNRLSKNWKILSLRS